MKKITSLHIKYRDEHSRHLGELEIKGIETSDLIDAYNLIQSELKKRGVLSK